ncbi:MAG TPA: DUF72 domain-containing protein [Chromatiales bacterium]|nr:DUF72 domain-containing protein [Chromatiales bacterium]
MSPAEPVSAPLCVGTSGWHYQHWRGVFYPDGVAVHDWLNYYSRHFSCVEVNNSFYRFPSEKAVRGWLEHTPPDFRFALKANRAITHLARLRVRHQTLDHMIEVAQMFGDRLLALLFQLPPRWRKDIDQLRRFLERLPAGFEYVMEFRDHSWLDEEVYALLRDYRVAFCQYELAGFRTPLEVTSERVYIRLHGPGAAYSGSYEDPALGEWAGRILAHQTAGRQVAIFFDNDEAGCAVQNARTLQQLLHVGGDAT